MSATAYLATEVGMIILSDGISWTTDTREVINTNTPKVWKLSGTCAVTWTGLVLKDRDRVNEVISSALGCNPREAIHRISDALKREVAIDDQLQEDMEANPRFNFFHINTYGYRNGNLEQWRMISAVDWEPKLFKEFIFPPGKRLFESAQVGSLIVGLKENETPWPRLLRKNIRANPNEATSIKEALKLMREISLKSFKKMIADHEEQGGNVGGTIYAVTISPWQSGPVVTSARWPSSLDPIK